MLVQGMCGLGWGRLQPGAEGEGRRAASKCSLIFAVFLEMRCKSIHYSVIPLMKIDKHFCRSETYFSINFNMEAQAQGAQYGDPSRSQDLGYMRHLLLGREGGDRGYLSLAGLGRGHCPWPEEPCDLSKPGPKPRADQHNVGRRAGLPSVWLHGLPCRLQERTRRPWY